MCRYDGEWVRDRKSGRGKQFHSDGSFYDGAFQDDQVRNQSTKEYPFIFKQHGNGSFSQGDFQIEGKWAKGMREGKAQLTFRYGNQKVIQGLDPLETTADEPWEQNFIPNAFPLMNS